MNLYDSEPHVELYDPSQLSDYGDEDVPLGLKLGVYGLHNHEWRVAFLTRLSEVGYIGLIEAASRVYDLLNAPKPHRCSMIAMHSGASGSGKLAIYNSLRQFLDEYLTMPGLPPKVPGEALDSWHMRVMAGWQSEQEREEAVVQRFARILDGNP